MKRLALLLPVLLLLAWTLPAAPVHAKNADWSNLAKEFKKNFKSKTPLKQRRQAIRRLAKSKDGRAIKELLKVIKTQEKLVRRMHTEWEEEYKNFIEKDARIREQVNRKREQAGGGSISVNEEEAEWLGSNSNPNPKWVPERRRIEGLYKQVREERECIPFLFESIGGLLNSLDDPEESAKALKDTTNQAKRAKADHRRYFIDLFATVRGEVATSVLEGFSNDTDVDTAIPAIEAIGRQNAEVGIDILAKRLQDPRWQVRAAAIKGLSYYKAPRIIDLLLAAAKKEQGVLRRKYYTALARIVQEAVPGTVEAWESFWRDNKDEYVERWAKYPKNEPVSDELPDIPIDTSLGSTSFYGIRTNSKHIIFVVDISGSMGEQGGVNEQNQERIDVARQELKQAIKSLSASEEDERGESSFNIVLFETSIVVYKEGKMVTATKKSKEKSYDWIDEHVKATGQTNLFDAIEQAFNIISEKSGSKNLAKGADTIFVMTDGAPSYGKVIDTELILNAVRDLNSVRKITLHAIGVGKGANAPFLRQLAAQNDGQYLSR